MLSPKAPLGLSIHATPLVQSSPNISDPSDSQAPSHLHRNWLAPRLAHTLRMYHFYRVTGAKQGHVLFGHARWLSALLHPDCNLHLAEICRFESNISMFRMRYILSLLQINLLLTFSQNRKKKKNTEQFNFLQITSWKITNLKNKISQYRIMGEFKQNIWYLFTLCIQWSAEVLLLLAGVINMQMWLIWQFLLHAGAKSREKEVCVFVRVFGWGGQQFRGPGGPILDRRGLPQRWMRFSSVRNASPTGVGRRQRHRWALQTNHNSQDAKCC